MKFLKFSFSPLILSYSVLEMPSAEQFSTGLAGRRKVLPELAILYPIRMRNTENPRQEMCVCLMIAEDGEYGADTLVHSLQADGAVGQLRTSLTHGVVLALLSGKNTNFLKQQIYFKRQ